MNHPSFLIRASEHAEMLIDVDAVIVHGVHLLELIAIKQASRVKQQLARFTKTYVGSITQHALGGRSREVPREAN